MSGEWSTPDGQRADKPIHCYPLNDLRQHVIDGDPCPCMPRSNHHDVFDDGSEKWKDQPDSQMTVIVHNSYDGREIGEVCRRALDMLGSLLADYRHTWTTHQRAAYEHAIDLLEMHYPPKNDEPATYKPKRP